MTNFGFALGVLNLGVWIWMGAFYINRGLYMLGQALASRV